MDKIPEPIKKKIKFYAEINQYRDTKKEYDETEITIKTLKEKKREKIDELKNCLPNMVKLYLEKAEDPHTIEALVKDIENNLKFVGIEGTVIYQGPCNHYFPYEIEIKIPKLVESSEEEFIYYYQTVDILLKERNKIGWGSNANWYSSSSIFRNMGSSPTLKYRLIKN